MFLMTPLLPFTLYVPNDNYPRSTDSELKLWDIEQGECKRTYKGHVNEKNFVGLSVSNDYISCGK